MASITVNIKNMVMDPGFTSELGKLEFEGREYAVTMTVGPTGFTIGMHRPDGQRAPFGDLQAFIQHIKAEGA